MIHESRPEILDGTPTFPEIQPANQQVTKMENVRSTKAAICTLAILPAILFHNAQAQTAVTAGEARAIAKEAYVYANPLVDSCRILYSYAVDDEDPDSKAPWNQILHRASAKSGA